MKKKNIVIISVVVILAATIVGIFVFLGQKDKHDTVPETTQGSVSVTSTQNEYETEPEIETEIETETEASTAPVTEAETNTAPRTCKFNFKKNDFEKRYSDEFLMEIAGLLGMRFGYEDFEHWEDDPETVINSLINCCIPSYNPVFKTIYTDDETLIRNINEEAANGYPNNDYISVKIVDPEILNGYFKDMFGPKARSFKAEEFMSFAQASAKNYEPYEDIRSEGEIRILRCDDRDLLCFYSADTGFACYSGYIYDIKERWGEYIVYTLGYDEVYPEGNDFESHQAAAYDNLTWVDSDYVENNIYTFGRTVSGDLYLKSVKQNYMFADDCEANYRIVKDTLVSDELAYGFPWTRVGELKKGDKVYVDGDERYIVHNGQEVAYILTEDFAGYVDFDCIEKIE